VNHLSIENSNYRVNVGLFQVTNVQKSHDPRTRLVVDADATNCVLDVTALPANQVAGVLQR
jgi:hypothetical protein